LFYRYTCRGIAFRGRETFLQEGQLIDVKGNMCPIIKIVHQTKSPTTHTAKSLWYLVVLSLGLGRLHQSYFIHRIPVTQYLSNPSLCGPLLSKEFINEAGPERFPEGWQDEAKQRWQEWLANQNERIKAHTLELEAKDDNSLKVKHELTWPIPTDHKSISAWNNVKTEVLRECYYHLSTAEKIAEHKRINKNRMIKCLAEAGQVPPPPLNEPSSRSVTGKRRVRARKTRTRQKTEPSVKRHKSATVSNSLGAESPAKDQIAQALATASAVVPNIENLVHTVQDSLNLTSAVHTNSSGRVPIAAGVSGQQGLQVVCPAITIKPNITINLNF